MTTLAITPNWKNKTAKFKGTIAAGEHVSVTIQNNDGEGGEFIADASTLRLRVVNPCNGRTLAVFPEPVPEGETPETWDSDLSPLRCTLNLNTVQMLKAVPPAANVSLLFVLDDYDNNTLYFKEQFPVEHWPRLRGEEEPTDLDNYKDIIADFNTRLDGYDTRITGAENAAQAATANASAAVTAADDAKTIANNAVDVAQQSKEAAETSQTSAAASATAAQNAANDAIAVAESINSPDATLAEEGVAADAKATGEAIAAEKTRAETAEATEKTRAEGVESGLRTDLTAAEEAIEDEAELRAAADSDLDANKADKSDTYTKSEVDAKVAGVQTFHKYLVQTLPSVETADMKGLYLVPTGEAGVEGDLCEEFTVVETGGEKHWEKIGAAVEVDLSDYYTKAEAAALLAGKLNNTTDTMDGNLTVSGALTVGTRKSSATVGTNSTAEGYDIAAAGDYSHAEGGGTAASGERSHAEGSVTVASGNYSHAEGAGTSAEGMCAHAEGQQCGASGNGSHAEGRYCAAQGYYSHAEGVYSSTGSNADGAHAEGYSTGANGTHSHAEGSYTITQNDSEHAEGRYNASHTGSTDAEKTIHSIGIGTGTSELSRKNAVEVMRDGKVFVKDVGGFAGVYSPVDLPVKDLATVISGKLDNSGDTTHSGSIKFKQGSNPRYTQIADTGITHNPGLVAGGPDPATAFNWLNGLSDHLQQHYASKESPAFTGTPTAPTAPAGTNTTQVATTAFVKIAVDAAQQAVEELAKRGYLMRDENGVYAVFPD